MKDEVKLFIPTSWDPSREEFLEALGISRGGLGEHFFGTVYDALFVNSVEVKSDFKKYYSVEYASLAEYLEIRYGATFKEDELEVDRVFMVTWLPQVIDNMYEENLQDTVMECIKKLGESTE